MSLRLEGPWVMACSSGERQATSTTDVRRDLPDGLLSFAVERATSGDALGIGHELDNAAPGHARTSDFRDPPPVGLEQAVPRPFARNREAFRASRHEMALGSRMGPHIS